MEGNHTKIVKNSFFLYLRMGIIMIISLFSVRLLLNALQVDNYGIYNAIGGVVTSFAFITTVLAGACQRYFSYSIGKKDFIQLNKDLGSIILVYLTIIIVFIFFSESLGIWFVKTKMKLGLVSDFTINLVYQLSLIAFIFNLISSPIIALFISFEDMNLYAVISIGDSVLKLLAVVVVYFVSTNTLITYSILICIISILTFIIYFLTVKFRYPVLKFSINRDIQSFKSILKFSSFSCFGSFANVCYHQGINILFNLFIGPVANAAYAIANQVNAAISTFGASFFMAVRPTLIKSYAKEQYTLMLSLFYFSTKIVFSLLYIIILPLVLNTNLILKLWLGEVTEYMIPFTQIAIISCLIMAIGHPITTIVQATGNNKKYHIYVDGFLILTIPIVYLILKLGYSPIIAFSITIIVFCIAHIIRLLVLKTLIIFSIKTYFYKCIWPIFKCLLISIPISLFTRKLLPLYLSELIYSIIFELILCISVYYLFLLNKKERIKVVNFIKIKLNIHE